MKLLRKLQIISKNSKSKSSKLFVEMFPEKTFLDIDYKNPSEYVMKYWNAYKDKGYNDKAVNGAFFELIIRTLFIREGLLPMYLQAKVAFIPNVIYDLILYNKEHGPIAISLKTSLRERRKQADLEAIALKYVHRKSICYLISLDSQEVEISKKEIQNGELLGLDNVILANGKEFDDLIDNLKKKTFTESGSVEVITSNQIVTSTLITKYGTERK